MKTNGYLARLVLLVACCSCGMHASLGADRAAIKKNLEEVFAYYLKDNGYWRQDNQDFKAGSGSPVAYLKEYSWGLDGVIVIDDTYALNEDGTCTQWTHNVFRWDEESNAISGQVYHFQGITAIGTVKRLEEDKTLAEFSVHLADGSQRRMKDVTDRSDPRKAVILASIWDGEKWNEHDAVSWRRIQKTDFACSH